MITQENILGSTDMTEIKPLEKQIIGALVYDFDNIQEIIGVVRAEMFESSLCSWIYSEYERAFEQGKKIDQFTLEQNVKDDNIREFLGSCISEHITNASLASDAEVLVKAWKKRKLEEILSKQEFAEQNIDNEINNLMEDLRVLNVGNNSKTHTAHELADTYGGEYFKEHTETVVNFGISQKLDEMVSLEGGDVTIIAARPSVGKSAFTTQIANSMSDRGLKVGFFNLEMSSKQLFERLVVLNSNIELKRLKYAIKFLNDEEKDYNNALEHLRMNDNLVITTGAKSVLELRADCIKNQYDVVIVDYLQLLKVGNRYRGNRAAEVGEVSREIKALATELNIPIIALSQLRRVPTGMKDGEPGMSDLKESGDIEQDASIIIMLWNTDETHTQKGVKVEKNRQGTLGKIVMDFEGGKMRFYDAEEDIRTVNANDDEIPFD